MVDIYIACKIQGETGETNDVRTQRLYGEITQSFEHIFGEITPKSMFYDEKNSKLYIQLDLFDMDYIDRFTQLKINKIFEKLTDAFFETVEQLPEGENLEQVKQNLAVPSFKSELDLLKQTSNSPETVKTESDATTHESTSSPSFEDDRDDDMSDLSEEKNKGPTI